MGLVFGGITVASPVAFRWLDLSTFHAITIALIAAVYIGFAVADGRMTVVAAETSVAAAFVVLGPTRHPWSSWWPRLARAHRTQRRPSSVLSRAVAQYLIRLVSLVGGRRKSWSAQR